MWLVGLMRLAWLTVSGWPVGSAPGWLAGSSLPAGPGRPVRSAPGWLAGSSLPAGAGRPVRSGLALLAVARRSASVILMVTPLAAAFRPMAVMATGSMSLAVTSAPRLAAPMATRPEP